MAARSLARRARARARATSRFSFFTEPLDTRPCCTSFMSGRGRGRGATPLRAVAVRGGAAAVDDPRVTHLAAASRLLAASVPADSAFLGSRCRGTAAAAQAAPPGGLCERCGLALAPGVTCRRVARGRGGGYCVQPPRSRVRPRPLSVRLRSGGAQASSSRRSRARAAPAKARNSLHLRCAHCTHTVRTLLRYAAAAVSCW